MVVYGKKDNDEADHYLFDFDICIGVDCAGDCKHFRKQGKCHGISIIDDALYVYTVSFGSDRKDSPERDGMGSKL